MTEQLKALWDYTQEVANEEMASQEEINFKEINAGKVQETTSKIDKALKEKKIDKKIDQN